jgi:hypothetical protein
MKKRDGDKVTGSEWVGARELAFEMPQKRVAGTDDA